MGAHDDANTGSPRRTAAAFTRLLPPGDPAGAAEIVDALDLAARARSGTGAGDGSETGADARRPYTMLNMTSTVDGRASIGGRSGAISSPADRELFHALRASVDAVIVGAGTVRADDPMLTVRNFTPANAVPTAGLDPLRVVLGRVPAGARIAPALEHQGDIAALLDDLGGRGVLQLMVEGGADVAGQFHRAGLVDEYVLYLAPAFMGGDRGQRAFAGEGAPTMADLTRGRFVAIDRLGDDLRIVIVVER